MHFVRSERATLTWFFFLFRKETTISLTQGLQYTLMLLTSHFSKKKCIWFSFLKIHLNSLFIFLIPIQLTNIFVVIKKKFFLVSVVIETLLRSLFILLCDLSPQGPFLHHERWGQQSLWCKHPTAECQWYLLTGTDFSAQQQTTYSCHPFLVTENFKTKHNWRNYNLSFFRII